MWVVQRNEWTECFLMDTKYSQRKIENELMANIMEKFLMF
jgi:hypothetical protein